ncbi:helix-turn-helix domain-containing protein [Acinetobacter schindleri]|uniref:HTH cro/C1-type domain-containing protein n=1 Tax=Acinetobacter schindleri CIP 107287 TaxID=1217988 RepID=N9AFQ4_9GAMM|nr:helix-turn-helix transcriptional regulator [Acinetobacter schindleri]ENV44924.1 hypothetical protein F955_01007 [Acinetobacter schindleri CIP 107287]
MRSIHDPRYQDLIKKLIELRESKNVTQVELARLLNKPQSYVSKVERLERRLDVIELIDWLKVLDINILDFLTLCDF